MPAFRLVIFAMFAIVCGAAHAQPYAGTLSGAAVEPPNGSPGNGTARVTFDSAFKTLKIEISFSGLASGTTRAQLHCCAAPPGSTIAATQLPGLDRFPARVVAGTHAQLLDLTAASSFNPAFVAANGGTVASAAAALATGLANGQAYLSISTSLFPAGEIRSFLLPANLLFVDGFETPAAALSLLRCDSPADGALVDIVPAASMSITGTALGLSNVQVNGTPVTVAAGRTFSSTVAGRYGVNFVELTGTDSAGTARTALCAFLGAQNWSAEGVAFNEALLFRAEPTGFQKVTSRYSVWFSRPELAQNLHNSLLAGNPLITFLACGTFDTCVREISYLGLATNTQFQGINVSAVNAQRLNILVAMDIPLQVRVRTRNAGIERTHDGTVTFDNAVFNVDVILGIDVATGVPSVRGQLNSPFQGSVTTQFPTSFDPQFRPTVIAESFNAVIPRIDVPGGATGLFQGLFGGMDITLPAAGYSVARLDGTGNVAVAMARRSGVVFNNNGLTVRNSLRMTTPPPPAGATGRFPFPFVVDPNFRPLDAWSATNVGIFNQMLQALWRVGAFDGTIDGAALGPGLPPGTSLQVHLRTMPAVIGFGAAGMTSLDVGALDLVVTHPSLPPALRVTAGARISAQGALASGDFVFTDFLAQEQFASTGAVTLSAAQRSALMDLLNRLFLKLGGVSLNDSLPVVPATVFTFPPSLAPYGLPAGNPLVNNPSLGITPNHLFLEGSIGIVP